MSQKTHRPDVSALTASTITTTALTTTRTLSKCNQKMRSLGNSNYEPVALLKKKRRAFFAVTTTSGSMVAATAGQWAMHTLALTALLYLLPPCAKAIDENLAALNRHQMRQFHHATNLADGGAVAVGSEKTAPRERRSLANGRWGLRPGKRSAATPAVGPRDDYDTLRLMAIDRPGAGSFFHVVPSPLAADDSTESGEDESSSRPLDLHALLINFPARIGSRSSAEIVRLPAEFTTPQPSTSNVRFFVMPPF